MLSAQTAMPDSVSPFLAPDTDRILLDLQRTQPPERVLHIVGVLQCSLTLCRIHGGDPNRVMAAALLHDCAKHYDRNQFEAMMQQGQITIIGEDLEFPSAWHGPAGAYLAKTRYGIEDAETLDAITNHTLGHERPSLTLQILMAADSCEPTRQYPEADALRQLVRENLRHGLQEVLKRKLEDLIRRGKSPHTRIYTSIQSLER